MSTSHPVESTDLQTQVTNLKAGIREVAHEINNPLGVLRMAAYLLESTNPDDEKRRHYVELISTSIDRIEVGLKRLKALREDTPPPDVSQRPSDKKP